MSYVSENKTISVTTIAPQYFYEYRACYNLIYEYNNAE